MIKKYLNYTLLTLSLSNIAFADSVDDIRWIGQDYKPYSYIENDNRTGMMVEIAEAMMKKIGSNKTGKDIEISAFSKSFIRKNNDANTVFFPLAQLPEREKYFKWVGPITTDEPVLFAKKSKQIKINSPEDLNKYTIAIKDGYSAEKLLKKIGVKSDALKSNDSDNDSLDAITQDKVDLIACNRLTCLIEMKDKKLNPMNYEVVFQMQGSMLSFAFNKDTDQEILDKFSKAFEEFKSTQEFKNISKRYLSSN